nr:hypothetical protein CFP56_24495 [Quercus suber]
MGQISSNTEKQLTTFYSSHPQQHDQAIALHDEPVSELVRPDQGGSADGTKKRKQSGKWSEFEPAKKGRRLLHRPGLGCPGSGYFRGDFVKTLTSANNSAFIFDKLLIHQPLSLSLSIVQLLVGHAGTVWDIVFDLLRSSMLCRNPIGTFNLLYQIDRQNIAQSSHDSLRQVGL